MTAAGLPSVVLLAGPGRSTDILFNALERHQAVRCVVLEQRVPRSRFLARRVRRLGPRTVAGQVLFQALVPPILVRVARRRIAEIEHDCGLDASPIPKSRVLRVESANSSEARDLLRRIDPDVVVINGTRILEEATLSAVPARFINVHAGITPMYRGVHGGYWALASMDAANCGVTVHEVDTGVDTGRILHQARIVVTRRDNFSTYPLLQQAAGVPLLLGHLADPGAATSPAVATAGPSRLWSHPTLWGYLRTFVRTGVW